MQNVLGGVVCTSADCPGGGDTLHEGTLYTHTPVQLSTILSGAGIVRLIITIPVPVLRSSVQ